MVQRIQNERADGNKQNFVERCLCIKKGERAGIGFPLIPTESMIGHPLEDYLDAYSIIWAMAQTAKENANPTLSASTGRKSMLEQPERVSELRATLLGCELCKDVDEYRFQKIQ